MHGEFLFATQSWFYKSSIAADILGFEVSLDNAIGTYYGASAKITVIAGDGEGVFNNANCVIVKLKTSGKGLQLSAPGAAAVDVSLDD